MTIVLLPGVEDLHTRSGRTETPAQLRVRIAALEAEVARLNRLLNDPDYVRIRAIKLLGGLGEAT